MKKKIILPCPHCKKAVQWGADSPYRPFCSDRCRLIDLGAWANEDYQLSEPDNGTQASTDPEAEDWHKPALH